MRTSEAFPPCRVLIVLACLGLATPAAIADDGGRHGNDHDVRASAVFGRGLNTAQRGNSVNHVVLPRRIKMKAGGVVDFSVAGFHSIVVFNPGFELSDLIDAGGGNLPELAPPFVIPPDPAEPLPPGYEFLADNIYYRGIDPAGGPRGTPDRSDPDNGSNRGEPVAFLEKGTYLVICNVLPHLVDGMYAFVEVR